MPSIRSNGDVARGPTRRTALMWLLLVALAPVLLPACATGPRLREGADLRVTSISNDPVQLVNAATTAVYRYRDSNSVTLVISDLPLDDLRQGRFGVGQLVAIDMFWRPKAGATPVDPTATNCAVRYVIFADQAVGVYGGGGFLRPRAEIGDDDLSGAIFNATLTLLERSEAFRDRLGAARMTGGFLAQRHDEAVSDIAVQLNSEISRRLGRLSLIMSD